MALMAGFKRWFHRRLKRDSWRYGFQGLDYGLVLPLMARLPLTWAYRLADWRGAFNARRARDWAELAVGFPYVGERCAVAFREIFPDASNAEISSLVVQRYQTVAREELDGLLAIRGRLEEIEMDLAPIRKALSQRANGRGLVVVMSHFDNLFLGLVGMARCGVPIYLMTSEIVQDARVHPKVRQFFADKYRSYVGHMGGGDFLPTSSNARDEFYRVLRQGGIVVVISETPASLAQGKGTWVSWMGKRRKMADSAVRMAMDTGSQMAGMRNRQAKPGRVDWQWSSLVNPDDFRQHAAHVAREMTYAPIFAFLEAGIKAEPGRWWAAHLLGDFAVEDGSHDP
jgi:lauroyl/myristoyl acyltransferase